jgi:hypothetical protein
MTNVTAMPSIFASRNISWIIIVLLGRAVPGQDS